MKLFYNKNSKDPIYYTQMGIRNGKKVTISNGKRFGKHSELLKITDVPPAYVREEIRKMKKILQFNFTRGQSKDKISNLSFYDGQICARFQIYLFIVSYYLKSI